MAEIQKELIEKRTANSKTFDLGNGRRQLVTHIGAIHYKDNYADKGEQWKDIDLTWEDNRITKAPYELTLDGKKLTLRDKKTGEVSTIELLSSNPAIRWEITPRNDKVSFRHTLPSDKIPFEAQFRITGKVPFVTRASDDEGELELETSFVDGILTEKLSQVKDKEIGQARPAKGNIRVDPTWSVGAAYDDCKVKWDDTGFWVIEQESIYQEVGRGSLAALKLGGGMRFTGVTIPQGATISAAYLTFRCNNAYSSTTVNSKIIGEGVDNAATWSTLDDYKARRGSPVGTGDGNKTTAQVAWDNIPAWTLGTSYNSPEIKTIIQEIISRPGWASGHALALWWDDHDYRSTHVTNVRRSGASWDDTTYAPPALYVAYEVLPDPPTNVAATENQSDKVVITWTKSDGATKYQVFRDGTPLGELGDVATHDDTGAGAPSITPGDAVAGDGGSTAHVALSLSETGTNNGTTHTYKVQAGNVAGWSGDSDTDTGYRAPGALGYQWQRSSGDSDADYGNIDGATSSTHNDTAAPAPTITPGDGDASDGLYTTHVALSLSGQSANVGDGRYYRCVLNASGCAQQISGVNRGYRGVGALTYQWQRSAADSDADYSNIPGATTASYDDTGAPKTGGRYYRCVENATGATQQISSSDRGYRVGETTYDTMVGSPTGWVWEKCDYEVSEKCPVGLETSWAWKVPTLAGPDKTPQGSPTLFSWGSE